MNLTPREVEALAMVFDILRRASQEAANGYGALLRQAGTELRERREGVKMTLRELARRLDVSAPFISDVEHGRRKLSQEMAARVEELFKEQAR